MKTLCVEEKSFDEKEGLQELIGAAADQFSWFRNSNWI
jgi:hypothetical protein